MLLGSQAVTELMGCDSKDITCDNEDVLGKTRQISALTPPVTV
jgi:hypothetical protein